MLTQGCICKLNLTLRHMYVNPTKNPKKGEELHPGFNQKFELQGVQTHLTWNMCTLQFSTLVTHVEQGPRHWKLLVFTRRQSVDVNKNHQEVYKSELPSVGFLVSQMEML